jgi:hypothetical protein
VTPEVETEVRAHRGFADPVLHTDYQASLCECSQVVASVPGNAALPDGGICFACGGMTVRTGTCTTCTGCGETGGCG